MVVTLLLTAAGQGSTEGGGEFTLDNRKGSRAPSDETFPPYDRRIATPL